MKAFTHLMRLRIVDIRANSTDDERVLIKVEEDCNLKNYILYDETFDEEGNPSNKVPHMFRFDSLEVKKGEYISLYTKGKKGYSQSKMSNPKDAPLHIIKRGLDITIFNQDGDKAHLVQINAEDSEFVKKKD